MEEEAFKAYIYSWTKRIVPNVATHCLLSWATRERNERTGQKRKGVGGIAHISATHHAACYWWILASEALSIPCLSFFHMIYGHIHEVLNTIN